MCHQAPSRSRRSSGCWGRRSRRRPAPGPRRLAQCDAIESGYSTWFETVHLRNAPPRRPSAALVRPRRRNLAAARLGVRVKVLGFRTRQVQLSHGTMGGDFRCVLFARRMWLTCCTDDPFGNLQVSALIGACGQLCDVSSDKCLVLFDRHGTRGN